MCVKILNDDKAVCLQISLEKINVLIITNKILIKSYLSFMFKNISNFFNGRE